MRGCFVTATDTGVGKTVVAAAIVATLRARAEPVRALKPVITGLAEQAAPGWPHDHVILARAAGADPQTVAIRSFDPAVSPHLAAELAGTPLDLPAIVDDVRKAAAAGVNLVVEGVGGLLVPLGDGWDVRRLAATIGLPLVIAARPGLGTINHTLLTLEAARSAGLTVAGVVLTPWPADSDPISESNRQTIERLGAVSVTTLATIAAPVPEALAAAGAGLPIDTWFDRR